MSVQEQAASTGQQTASEATTQQQEQQQPAQPDKAAAVPQQEAQKQEQAAPKQDAKEAADPLAGVLPQDPNAGKEPAKADVKPGEEGAAGDYDVAVPEGFVVNDGVMQSFKDTLKETGISKEHAQKLFDIYTSETKRNAQEFQDRVNNDANRIDGEWYAACKSHPELGGANFERSQSYAISAIKRLVPTEEQNAYIQQMNELRLRNNPHIWGMLVRAGKMLGEAEPVTGKSGAPKMEKTIAQQFWGHLENNKE